MTLRENNQKTPAETSSKEARARKDMNGDGLRHGSAESYRSTDTVRGPGGVRASRGSNGSGGARDSPVRVNTHRKLQYVFFRKVHDMAEFMPHRRIGQLHDNAAGACILRR